MPDYTALLAALRAANLQKIHEEMVFLLNNTQASQFDLLDLAEDLSKEKITQTDMDLSRLLVYELYEGDSNSYFIDSKELYIKNSITSLNEALIGASLIRNQKTPLRLVKASIDVIVKKDIASPPIPKTFSSEIQKTVAEGINQYILAPSIEPFLGNDLPPMQEALKSFGLDLPDDSLQTITNMLEAEKKRTQSIVNMIGPLQEEIDNYTQAIDELSPQITALETQILADKNILEDFKKLNTKKELLASINPAEITKRLDTLKPQLYELEIERTSLSGKRTIAIAALNKIKVDQLNEKIKLIDQAITNLQPKVASHSLMSAFKAIIISWFNKANQSLKRKQTPSPQKQSLFSFCLLSCFRPSSKEEKNSDATRLNLLCKFFSSSPKKPEQKNTNDNQEPPTPH